jgi:hypothetical protein
LVVDQQQQSIGGIEQGPTAFGSLEHGLNMIRHERFLAVCIADFQRTRGPAAITNRRA